MEVALRFLERGFLLALGIFAIAWSFMLGRRSGSSEGAGAKWPLRVLLFVFGVICVFIFLRTVATH